MPRSDSTNLFRLLLSAFVFVFLFAPTHASDDGGRWTANDPCPSTIHATIPGGSSFSTYKAVHKAMRICNNITELHMRTTGGSCTEWADGYSLPFKLDGSDRYLSAPHVLSLEEYEFDSSEWRGICPGYPHWSNEDGSWPMSSSTSSVITWTTDLVYGSRWHFDLLVYGMKNIVGWDVFTPWWHWWNSGMSQKWYDQRHLPAERRSMDNMELWVEAMDFSKVHTLSINELQMHPKGKGLYESLPPALVGLDSLSIHGRWIDWRTELEKWEAAPGPLPKNKWSTSPPPRALDFILAVRPSLKSLTWVRSGTCCEDVFNRVLEYHGSSLKQLEWTNPEIDFSPRPILSLDQFRSLGKWAPELTNLTIDLQRVDEDWPGEQLKVIAETLPKLTNLVIYLNMQDEAAAINKTIYTPEEQLMAKPALNTEAALDMIQTLRYSKAGDKLDTVEFRQGDWVSSTNAIYHWMDGKKDWVKCNMLGQDRLPECEAGHYDWWAD
ncbi:hypothetical protein FSARC_11118 [Fusarium sarcochroum]|uniref:Uncharacterized protein n=1 Tax=Fusarium sarcochroum TaxID=1208366 RepID=A0A8H4X160_9HYPO|nr:hypothetical protein FSARC_11118 [Fusarium sarcochroum]